MNDVNTKELVVTDKRKKFGLKNYIESLKEGFTLIELVTAIAILIILISIAVPQIMNVMDRAWTVRHMSNISNIEKAMSEWGQTNMFYAAVEKPVAGATYGNAFRVGVDAAGTMITTGAGSLPATGEVLHPIVSVTAGSDAGMHQFTTDGGDQAEVSLLIPVTNNHPIVRGNFMSGGAPNNPWLIRPEYREYVYTVDFAVKKAIGRNPNGTHYQESDIIPQARLMRRSGDNLVRNDYIIVVNDRNPVRTGVVSDRALITDDTIKQRERVYGYNFFTKKSGADNSPDPASISVIP